MATFQELKKRTNEMADSISHHTGVEKSLVMNVITYARLLPRPETPDYIDELVFIAQMESRFGITSSFHIKLIYEDLREKQSRMVRLDDYVRMVCIFYSRILWVKVDFVFSVYDIHKEGFILWSGMNMLLKTAIVAVGDEEQDEQLKELIDIVVGMMDSNEDGKISKKEFMNYVERDILFIQILGQVLPLEDVIDRFMYILKKRTPEAVREYFADERRHCLHEPYTAVRKKELYPIKLDIP